MKQFNAVAKCQKKAFSEIKLIKNAPNMVDVEQLINVAILKTFGFWNIGLEAVKAKKQHTQMNFEIKKMHRINNKTKFEITVRQYLYTLIPERLKKTILYQNLNTK